MRAFARLLSVPAALLLTLACACSATGNSSSETTRSMQIQFLEIVTPEVDATCSSLAKLHDVTFSDPVAEFGNSRTAQLSSGGLLSVRAPMHADETPVVRPYMLVDDIAAATKAAEAAGGEIALPPTEIPGRGTFSIYFQGGIQHGLWQL